MSQMKGNRLQPNLHIIGEEEYSLILVLVHIHWWIETESKQLYRGG